MLEPLQHDSLSGTGHGFFNRHGGLSTGLYQSLNCGLGSQDDPVSVQANLHLVEQQLRAKHLVTLRQIHSTRVVTVTEEYDYNNRMEADALVTNQSGIALGVLSADCAPILFSDPTSGVVAAAHAGWKGALHGVAEATVAAMCALGAEHQRISAVVGPSIAQASYEVDAHFRDHFIQKNSTFAAFFHEGIRDHHYQFDLEGFLIVRLQEMSLGVVSGLGVDTYPEQNGYFSFRRCTHRLEADYGRQISAIMLD